MKYLIVSDIHGSYESSNIIVDKFNKHNCDKILILGDILYHGPRNDLPDNYNPKKVIATLNPISDKIIAVRGNCDAEVDQMVLDFIIHDEYRLIDNNKTYVLTHGHHLDELELNNVDVVLYGHTHIIRKYQKDNVTFINLGSITIPKENTARCYAILENDNVSIYDINDNLIKD